MAAIDDIINLFGYLPSQKEFCAWLHENELEGKAAKYLLIQVAEANNEEPDADCIKSLVPDE